MIQSTNKLSGNWLTEPVYLKLHLELTLLAARYQLKWEVCEDIASDSLKSLWEQYQQDGFTFPIKPYLIASMKYLVRQCHKEEADHRLIENQYLITHYSIIKEEIQTWESLSVLFQYIPFLEPDEKYMLEEIVYNNRQVSEIATHLKYPLFKGRSIYKHLVFKLQKRLGLWKRMNK